VPIGILSNASTCDQPRIRESLLKLDGRFMKLDAGSSATFAALNRPSGSGAWDRIVHGLSQLPRIVLQSMFVTGRVDNTSDKEIEEWIKVVHTIKPEAVQVYTIQRKPEHPDILPVTKEKLQMIACRLTNETHIPAMVYD